MCEGIGGKDRFFVWKWEVMLVSEVSDSVFCHHCWIVGVAVFHWDSLENEW